MNLPDMPRGATLPIDNPDRLFNHIGELRPRRSISQYLWRTTRYRRDFPFEARTF